MSSSVLQRGKTEAVRMPDKRRVKAGEHDLASERNSALAKSVETATISPI